MRADLHIHSSFSPDGRQSVEEIMDAVKAKGIGCIAITDHNSFESYSISSKYGDIIVVPGEEVSSSGGHILAYGINSMIPKGKGVEETIDLIHDAGGIAVAAHPYRWRSGLGEKNVVEGFDAIETFNSRSTKGGNMKASRLASRMKRPFTAGSDAHRIEHIGGAFIEISDDMTDWESVVKAILNGKATAGGEHRTVGRTIGYGSKAITEWIGRGFRRI